MKPDYMKKVNGRFEGAWYITCVCDGDGFGVIYHRKKGTNAVWKIGVLIGGENNMYMVPEGHDVTLWPVGTGKGIIGLDFMWAGGVTDLNIEKPRLFEPNGNSLSELSEGKAPVEFKGTKRLQ